MSLSLSRRGFVGAVTAASAGRVLGANDRIRLGIIGSGGRGRYLMSHANKAGNIQWVAAADAYDVQRERAEKAAGTPIDKYVDYRKVLDRKDIDAVIIATWDHMHSEIAVAACRAGKDLYVEKPLTLHPMEGHQIVRAVRQHKRILQTGTQQRTYPHFIEAKERFIDSGRIGRVTMVRTIWNGNRAYRNQAPPPGMAAKPEGMDWDTCQGRLPKVPWDAKRYFNHYVYWDYSTNAQMGGLFVHMVDVAHWYLKVARPLAATCMGGIYLGQEGRDTADNINSIVEYPGGLLVTFEANVTDVIAKENADIVFMGTGGRLHIFRHGYRYLPSEEGAQEIVGGPTPELHVANWLECVRSRKPAACDEAAGHYSAMACHICNISYREKRRVTWQKEWDV
ncbi:MAG TPA: Gfo/Idh/MocA family oxidoreductase [Bryobacteraceae bacterium]|nr:Gfo/Idh/MocA family oxidoreductase [Bryobacteraceae bacterium]